MASIERIHTGVRNLDSMIEGGFIKNRVYMLCGPPGSGKTTFGTQFIVEGAKNGEKCLYVTTMDDPKNIVMDMSRYNFNVIEHYKARNILFLDLSEGKIDMQSGVPKSMFVIQKIADAVRGLNISRIVIDSFSSIKFSSDDEKTKKRDTDMFVKSLMKMGATVVLLSEMLDSREYSDEHFSVHGLIYLHHFLHKQEMIRAMQVIKMRGTYIDSNMVELVFGTNGISITGRKVLQS